MARIDGELRSSVAAIDDARLAAVEEQAGTLADLLGIRRVALNLGAPGICELTVLPAGECFRLK